MDTFYLIGFIQALFFCILILSKKQLSLKDIILFAYILILGLDLLFIYALETEIYNAYPFLIYFDFAYWTLLGPLLFVYIDLASSERNKFVARDLIHLLPIVLVLICFSDFIWRSDEANFYKYSSDSLLYNTGLYIWFYNSPLYYIISIVLLWRRKNWFKQYYSSAKHVSLQWLNFLVHGFALFLLFLITRAYLLEWLNLELPFSGSQLSWFVLVIYIFGIGFYGYKQKGIFNDGFEFEKIPDNYEGEALQIAALNQNPGIKIQYQKSGLNEGESQLILGNLTRHMKNTRPYLDCELNMKNLAEAIDTSTHKLSQVINEKLNTSFYDYVNNYRVEDVKRLLADPEKQVYKIMTLAYDCGFNSKSGFYSTFKKYTSKTPTEYRNEFLRLEVLN